MKISEKKLTLKEALRRRAQRRALKEAVEEHNKKSQHFVLEEDAKSESLKKFLNEDNSAEFFKESDDEEVIEIDDEGDAPVDSDEVADIEVTDGDDVPPAEDDVAEDPAQEIKDAIRILAANAGMTAADFEELAPAEEPVEEAEEVLMSAADFFNQGGTPSEPAEESCKDCEESKKEEVCEDDDDEEEKPAEETPPSEEAPSTEETPAEGEPEPVGDGTTDLSVDTEVADLSGATDLSADIVDTTPEVSGTVDNPATPEEEETAETAKKLADMTPEDWFQLLNQI